MSSVTTYRYKIHIILEQIKKIVGRASKITKI